MYDKLSFMVHRHCSIFYDPNIRMSLKETRLQPNNHSPELSRISRRKHPLRNQRTYHYEISILVRNIDNKGFIPLWPSSYVSIWWNYAFKQECHIFEFFSQNWWFNTYEKYLVFLLNYIYTEDYTLKVACNFNYILNLY